MGTWISCSFDNLHDLDSPFKPFLMRPLSFNGRDSEPSTTSLKSYGSAKNLYERSSSLKRKESERMFPYKTFTATMEIENMFGGESPSSKSRNFGDKAPRSDASRDQNTSSPMLEPRKERNQAALKLQKVYKSFRTRRKLADCAVMVEQRWWKLLDFAELKRSSISFFDIEKPETAISRWSRARKRAAKVGKGLSKDDKARKLALQHWLEAIDPRHRYGHNLQFYYIKWLHCESKQPFFYWIDIGEGKEVNLEICPRPKLHQQCIKYLGPTERETYEVAIQDGKFMYKHSLKLLDTRGGPSNAKWIFVLSASKVLYVGMKSKGTFQHSSFLAGGATLSAGRLVVEDGTLKAVWPHSGHYLPTEENFQEFMTFLKEHNVDLSGVEKNPSYEEYGSEKSRKSCVRNDSQAKQPSFDDTSRENTENSDLGSQEEPEYDHNGKPLVTRLPIVLPSKITMLEIPKRNELSFVQNSDAPPSEDGYETAAETFLMEEDFVVPKLNLFEDDKDQDEDDEKAVISKEKIMKRIDSHKGMKSYQLGQHLSTRWSTGAGPRIGCMRDYPLELQFLVLEEANLSPRSKGTFSSPRNLSRFNNQKVLVSQNSLGFDTTSCAITTPKLAQEQVITVSESKSID